MGREPEEVRPVSPSEPFASLPTTKTTLYSEDSGEEATLDKTVLTSIRSDECVSVDFSAFHTIAGAADTELRRVAMKVGKSFMASTVVIECLSFLSLFLFFFKVGQSIRNDLLLVVIIPFERSKVVSLSRLERKTAVEWIMPDCCC